MSNQSCVDCKRYRPSKDYVTFFSCSPVGFEPLVMVPRFFNIQAEMLPVHEAGDIGRECLCFVKRGE